MSTSMNAQKGSSVEVELLSRENSDVVGSDHISDHSRAQIKMRLLTKSEQSSAKFSKIKYQRQIREAAQLNLLNKIQQIKVNEKERFAEQEEIILSYSVNQTRNLTQHLNKFLSESYDKAARKTQETIEITKQSILLTNKIKALDDQIEYLKADLIFLEEKSNDYLRYQQFLFHPSPFSWKNDNRQIGECMDISTIVIPKMYFSAPDDILNVFQRKTQQSLHLFSKCEQLSSEMSLLNQEIKSIEKDHIRNQDKLLRDVCQLHKQLK